MGCRGDCQEHGQGGLRIRTSTGLGPSPRQRSHNTALTSGIVAPEDVFGSHLCQPTLLRIPTRMRANLRQQDGEHPCPGVKALRMRCDTSSRCGFARLRQGVKLAAPPMLRLSRTLQLEPGWISKLQRCLVRNVVTAHVKN